MVLLLGYDRELEEAIQVQCKAHVQSSVRLLTLSREDRPSLSEELALWLEDASIKKLDLARANVQTELSMDPSLLNSLGDAVIATATALLRTELIDEHSAIRISIGSVPCLLLLNDAVDYTRVLFVSIELQPMPGPVSVNMPFPTEVKTSLLALFGLNTLMLLYLFARK